MKRPRWISPILLVLLLAACGEVTVTAPTEIEAAAWDGASQLDGAAFLPPVGPSVDTGDFDPGVDVVVKIVLPDGSSGGEYSTADGSVRVKSDFYMLLWDVGRLTRQKPSLSGARVEVWVSDLSPNSALATACGGTGPCRAAWFDAIFKRPKRGPASPTAMDLSKSRTLPIKFYVAGAEEGALRPTTLSELHRLGQPTAFFEDVASDTPYANCTVNEFTMPGQGLNALGSGLNALGSGLNALGSVGGMFLFEPGTTPGAPGVRLFETAEAGELADGLMTDTFERNAAILIVDDFGGIVDENVEGVYELDTGLTDPSETLDEAGLRALVEGPEFSHGALVLHQTLQMVEAAGFTVDTSFLWSDVDFHVFSKNQGEGGVVYLVVAAVDTDGFDTDQIPTRIQNALNALRYYGEIYFAEAAVARDIRHVAINMSFAIVPCSVLEDFDASALTDFAAYRDALGADNGVAEDFYDELAALLVAPLGSDPLFGQVMCDQEQVDNEYGFNDYYLYDWSFYVESADYNAPNWGCASFDRSTVYVASSGNFGLPYSMYPAAWPEVLAVGAQDGLGTIPAGGFSATKSSFSNSAEVIAPGSVFLLGESATGARALGFAGTSFSAPVGTLYTALDLMQDAPDCTSPTVSDLTSEADTADTPLDVAVAKCL